MTIILLASVSLFALVVTSRPILPSDVDLRDSSCTSCCETLARRLFPLESASTVSTLQTGAQAPFRIHLDGDDLSSDAARFHFQKSKQQLEYENAAAAATFQISPGEPLPLSEGLSDGTIQAQDTFDADDVNDDSAISESVVEEHREAVANDSPSVLLMGLTLSCITALLALACIAVVLYIIKSLRSKMLGSKAAWDLLPAFWRRPRSQDDTSAAPKQQLSGGGCLLLQTETGQQHLFDADEGSAQRSELQLGVKSLYFDAVSDIESEWEDVDEKYQDALDMTPVPLIHNLPLEANVSHPSHFDDPPLPHLLYPFDLPTADRSMPVMRELCLSPSSLSRPAWSVRAMDSPALGISSRQGDVDANVQPLIHPRRRAYRSPVPELDIALAMQLRPGLGIGADSAWMVRFLMAIFGWFAVALTGNAR